MNEVSCQFDLQGRSDASPVTVGDKLLLACDGEMSLALKSPAQVVFKDEKLKYTMQALEVKESSSQNFKLIVTSYQPGEFKSVLEITDGVLSVKTNELNWKVETILDPKKKPEPFPSKGPFMISYPIWLWVALASAVLVLAAGMVFFYFMKKRRRRLMLELEEFQTMLSPISQFSKDIRKSVRDLSQLSENAKAATIVSQIDRDFRLYLIRELKVPAIQVSDGQLIREIKRSHPTIHDQFRADFRKVLSELSKAKSDNEKLKTKDGEDLTYLTRKLAEGIYSMRRKSK